MPKYNLHVTSVPDHKAQVVLARIIVGADSMIHIQQAMEMATKPPLLLFHNLERKDLKPHIDHLNSLGVEFSLSEVQEALDDSDVNFGGRGEAHEPERQPADPPSAPPAAPPEPQPPLPKPAEPLTRSQPSTPPERPQSAHAAGHDYHAPRQHGSRIGAVDAAAMKAAEDASRKKSLIFSIAAVAVLLIIGIFMLYLPKDNKANIEKASNLAKARPEKKPAPPKTKPDGRSRQSAAAASDADTAARPDPEPPVQASAQEKQLANAYVDSARADDGDLRKSVAFYKAAISFNRQNLAAWQGLLQAYRELHMDAEAHETERKMKAVFGKEALSVGNAVKSYGELVDISVNWDGAHTVEYKTAKSSKVDILRDAFAMTRAVRAACGCDNIFLRVSAGSGKEVTVHSTGHTSIHSLSEFMRQAEIVWPEAEHE